MMNDDGVGANFPANQAVATHLLYYVFCIRSSYALSVYQCIGIEKLESINDISNNLSNNTKQYINELITINKLYKNVKFFCLT